MDRADAYRVMRGEGAIWCIDPMRLESIAAIIASGAKAAARQRSVATGADGVGIIGIVGPLSRRAGLFSEIFGASTYDGIRMQLRDALARRDVTRIVLWVDSPGGAALGVEELADEIAAAARIKPITAIADVLMASAALWLGSQAGKIIATPSAEIGSVGAVMLHLDHSAELAQRGVKPTWITSRVSPFKVEGNPAEPLGDEAREHMQGQIDELAGRFVRSLARGRKVSPATVRERFGRGRTMFADDARRAGLADAVGTFDQVLAGTPAPAPGARASSDARARRLALLRHG